MRQQKFKIKDIVKVNKGRHKGSLAEVVDFSHVNGRFSYEVMFDNNDKHWFYPDYLNLVEKGEEKTKKPSIDLSDKIRITTDNFDEIAKEIIKKKTLGHFITNDGIWWPVNSDEFYINSIGAYMLGGRHIDMYGYMPNAKLKVISWVPLTSISVSEAREMYYQGGTAKKVALKTYSEDEIKCYCPETWKEYCKNASGQFYYINSNGGKIESYKLAAGIGGLAEETKYLLPTRELTEKLQAFTQLLSLHHAWVNVKESDKKKLWYFLCTGKDSINIGSGFSFDEINGHPFYFPSMKMAEKFKKCFSDLLNKAKGIF